MVLYGMVLANIKQYYADDPSMAFVLLDYYYLQGDYNQVIRSTEKLMKSFGVEDANLLVIKANSSSEQKKYTEVQQIARHSLELEPQYEYGYWALLSAEPGEKNFGHAVETAKVLQSQFGYDLSPSSLSGNPTYADFVTSVEYKSWRAGK